MKEKKSTDDMINNIRLAAFNSHNVNPLQPSFQVETHKFNSTNNIRAEIPQDKKKIVDDLFDDSYRGEERRPSKIYLDDEEQINVKESFEDFGSANNVVNIPSKDEPEAEKVKIDEDLGFHLMSHSPKKPASKIEDKVNHSFINESVNNKMYTNEITDRGEPAEFNPSGWDDFEFEQKKPESLAIMNENKQVNNINSRENLYLVQPVNNDTLNNLEPNTPLNNYHISLEPKFPIENNTNINPVNSNKSEEKPAQNIHINKAADVMEKNKNINFDNLFMSINLRDAGENNNNILNVVNNNNRQNFIDYDKEFNINKKPIANLESKFASVNQDSNLNRFSINVNSANNFNNFDKNPASNYKTKSELILGRYFDSKTVLNLNKPFGISKYSKELKETKEKVKKRKEAVVLDQEFTKFRYTNNPLLKKNLTSYLNLDQETCNVQVTFLFQDILMNIDTDNLRTTYDTFFLDPAVNLAPIGFLNPLNAAESRTGRPDVQNIFKEMSQSVTGFRQILNDGNSFARAFTFGILESFILQGNIFGIKKIILDINEKLSVKNFDVVSVLGTFYLILDYMDSSRIILAYETLLKAYYLNKNFDLALVVYFKMAIESYLKTNPVLTDYKDPALLNLLPTNYITDEGYLGGIFLEDNLLSVNQEVAMLIIYLAPIVFNFNLDLFIIEGLSKTQENSFYELKLDGRRNNSPFIQDPFNSKSSPVFFKQTFPCLISRDSRCQTISFLYTFKRFDLLYTIKNYDLPFSFFSQGEVDFSQRIKITAQLPCEVCKQSADFVTIQHMPQLTACKNCVEECLKKIFLKRSKDFTKEGFTNTEYYCRPILFDREYNEMLYDEDCLFFINKTIPQALMHFLEGVCASCGKNIPPDAPLMPCGCKFCLLCVEEKVKVATGGKMVLNNFEKAYAKLEKPKCNCGNIFDSEVAVQSFLKDAELYKIRAAERLVGQALTYCMLCRTNLKKRKDDSININKLPVIQDDDVTAEHVVCKSCLLSIRGDVMTKSRSGEINASTKYIPIKCSVCVKKTHRVELKYLRALLKSEGGCCSVL